MKFASLCILNYERPEFFSKSFESLVENTTYLHERIVHDDSSTALPPLNVNAVSKLILSHGGNRGIGYSFRACADIAEGDYIYKLDADLEYKPLWLEQTTYILNTYEDVGAVGLFNYQHYNPTDERFLIEEEREHCYIVTDFVGSAFGIRRKTYEAYRQDVHDDGFQLELKKYGFKLAIPKTDVAVNFGFGMEKSVYLHTKEYKKEPLLFGHL